MIALPLFACLRRSLLLTRSHLIVVVAFACGVLAAYSPLRAADDAPGARAEGIRLRVLTLNMYGLRYPPRLGWTADRSDCAGRFKAVAAQIRNADPPYDIVAIQEMYRVSDLHIVTCDPTPFLEELERAGDRFGGSRRILFAPKGESWKLEADGGIGLITRHSIVESQTLRFVGAGGPLFAARGVVYARIALPNSQAALDAYVVHLSPGRRTADQRRRELEGLAKLIAANSSGSGNPVIVLGDFNIEGPPMAGGEYGTILKLLGRPRDLWLEDGGTDPGYTYDCFGNAVAALRGCDYRARIDYLWIVSGGGLSNSAYEVKVEKGNVRKVEWHTESRERLPVSDHYGVEALFSIERRSTELDAKRDRDKLSPSGR